MKTSIETEKAKKERKKRGRKRLVDKILSSLDVEEEKAVYVVVYDFYTGRIPKEFYIGLKYLNDEGYFIFQLQKSVILTSSKRCALAIKELAKHYGARVHAFKIEKEL